MALAIATALTPPYAHGQCIHFKEAKSHIGATQCVQGKVLHVKEGNRGATFLDFCDDYRACTFTVVVFSRDLKYVGDVRYLQGKDVEIHGKIQEYDGRAEIILSRYKQLRGEAARIPPLSKDYDVEKRGRYSAGSFRHPSTAKKPSRKRQGPPVSIEDTTADAADR
jgi:DNA/RNA endonuclease YhcR with UshA esterase domain